MNFLLQKWKLCSLDPGSFHWKVLEVMYWVLGVVIVTGVVLLLDSLIQQNKELCVPVY